MEQLLKHMLHVVGIHSPAFGSYATFSVPGASSWLWPLGAQPTALPARPTPIAVAPAPATNPLRLMFLPFPLMVLPPSPSFRGHPTVLRMPLRHRTVSTVKVLY